MDCMRLTFAVRAGKGQVWVSQRRRRGAPGALASHRHTYRKRLYGPGNHGSGTGAAVRRGAEAVQYRPEGQGRFAAGALCGFGRHLAGPGAQQVRRGVQADHESAEAVRRDLQPAYALSTEESPAHRGIPEPALAPCRNAPMSRQSMRWWLSAPTSSST